MKIKERFEKKLLVEGNDDQHVVWALCEKFKVPETFDVIDCNGLEKLQAGIEVRLTQSEVSLSALGIVIDADDNFTGRWDSLKGIISNAGFDVPEELLPDGLVIENDDGLRVGVWIMPDNNLNGMLEDFIAFLVPDGDPLWATARSTLDEIENRKLNKYSPNYRAKAEIHTWLAWQEAPGTPLGQAITKKYLTADEETCSKFISWLNCLFNPSNNQ